MVEWLKNFLIAIGGGTVVLVGMVTIFKGLLLKLFETGLESSFEKNLAKYKNKLERTTRAYEMLLDCELRFYERVEPISAEAVPLINDVIYVLTNLEKLEQDHAVERLKQNSLRFAELIKTLKNETLTHQVYIPMNIFSVATNAVSKMQEALPFGAKTAHWTPETEQEIIVLEMEIAYCDQLLGSIAELNCEIKKRLMELSNL